MAGVNGVDGGTGIAIGGGIAIVGTATIDNTTVTGNTAAGSENDVDGTFNTEPATVLDERCRGGSIWNRRGLGSGGGRN